jgi:NAD(P)H-dependent FMN reductase
VRITAIVGSYHKGGMIDSAVEAMLEGARQRGAEAEKIFLSDRRIEYCRNCQQCTQESGPGRGRCQIEDDMAGILDRVDTSEGLILASPVNFWTVTAVMKCFIERLICYGYWPWNAKVPRPRNDARSKRAVIVASSAAPACLGRYGTSNVKIMKKVAKLLGAGVTDTLFIGLARHTPDARLSARYVKRARKLGERLARS